MKKKVIIIGGGIIGLSTALSFLENNEDLDITVLEKEKKIAQHQTGHNSGVIHSGIYYKPGSAKALNCKIGYQRMLDFAVSHNIPYDICGKIIVATRKEELQALENIFQRGVQNGLTGVKKITAEEAREIEPYVNAVAAVWVPQAGIIDYKEVASRYAELITYRGGSIKTGQKVARIFGKPNEVKVITQNSEYECNLVVNCSGLYSDRIGSLTDHENNLKILPFRGEYYELSKEREYLVKNLIYPVPNPDFPFLGVHFTRMIKGGIEAGPNAVLAFRREGYSRWQIHLPELLETLAFSGFRKVATKYWDDGWMEMRRSFSKHLFVKALQDLIPEINPEDVHRAGAGVRAQACDSEGNLVDDFLIRENELAINVYNAPSPAATASLAIGEHIAELLKRRITR